MRYPRLQFASLCKEEGTGGCWPQGSLKQRAIRSLSRQTTGVPRICLYKPWLPVVGKKTELHELHVHGGGGRGTLPGGDWRHAWSDEGRYTPHPRKSIAQASEILGAGK